VTDLNSDADVLQLECAIECMYRFRERQVEFGGWDKTSQNDRSMLVILRAAGRALAQQKAKAVPAQAYIGEKL
jgi:hypothetical protein